MADTSCRVLALVVLFAIWAMTSPVPGQVAGEVDRPDSEITIHYASHPLATPIELLPGEERLTTQIELRCDRLTAEGGKAVLSLSRCEFSFNEFGDATTLRELDSWSYFVSLVPVDFADPTGEDRRLYLLEFKGGHFANRAYFVRSPERVTPSRLYVRSGDDPLPVLVEPLRPFEDLLELAHILEMNNQLVPQPRAGERTREDIAFHTPYFHSTGKASGGRQAQGYISVRGTLHQEASFTHDMNHISFTPFGDVGMSTMIGFLPTEVQLVQHDVDDPRGEKRRLFNLVPAPPSHQLLNRIPAMAREGGPSFRLVVHPDLSGPHRLIVSERGETRHVLPLYDEDWRRYLQKQPELAQVSPAEQHAIDNLWRLLGRRFDFSAANGRVTTLSLRGDTQGAAALAELRSLPHLTSLRLEHCREVHDAAYAALERLPGLEHLHFYQTPVSDDIVRRIAALKRLQMLSIYDEPDPDQPQADVPHVTDRGLAALAAMDQLRDLSLCGDGITDEGLLQLASLPRLEHLHLHRTAASTTGIVLLGHALSETEIRAELVVTSAENGELGGLSVTLHDAAGRAVLSGEVDDSVLSTMPLLGQLTELHVGTMPGVTDDGLAELARLEKLRKLSLRNGRLITDKGLVHLHKLRGLKQLEVHADNITAAGIAALRAALPDCKVNGDGG